MTGFQKSWQRNGDEFVSSVLGLVCRKSTLHVAQGSPVAVVRLCAIGWVFVYFFWRDSFDSHSVELTAVVKAKDEQNQNI